VTSGASFLHSLLLTGPFFVEKTGRNMQTLTAEFLGKEVTLVDNNGVAYVAMREIVEGIGLSWGTQSIKLNENSKKFNCFHIETVGADGKNRQMLCMPIKKLNGWLFSINPKSNTRNELVNGENYCSNANQKSKTLSVSFYKLNN